MSRQNTISTHDHRSSWHILGDHRIGPHDGPPTHHYLAKNFAARAKIDAVLDDRHVIQIQISAPQSHLLSNHHVFPQLYTAPHHHPLGMGKKGGQRKGDSKFTSSEKSQDPCEEVLGSAGKKNQPPGD